LCALFGSSAVLAADGSQCCHFCCRDSGMIHSHQPVCFAGRYLGHQLSDSVPPDAWLEGQRTSNSDDRVAASSSTSASQPFLS
jgi:hypothetical protein